MFVLLYIPWFKLEAWKIPFPVIGNIPIQPFGLLVATGVILGTKACEWRAQKVGVATSIVTDMAGHVIISGFIFGHMLDSIFYYPDKVAADPWFLLQIWNGLSSFGGFTGAVIGALIWKLRRKASLIAVGDPIAWCFPLGWMFGRMGCFVVHDHPGIVTDFPLAVADYHIGYPPWQPRHDLGFYEIIWSAVTMLLFWYLGRTPKRRGFFMALLPMVYTPVRFFLDYLRAPPESGGDIRYFNLTPGQYGAILLFVAGAALMWRVMTKSEPELPIYKTWPPPKTP